MSINSNFLTDIKSARQQALLGPNVISRALPYLGGGLLLTTLGTYGGLGVINTHPGLFMPTFLVALVLELVLFFAARGAAQAANNALALPMLATYSLLSGYTLTGLVYVALGTPGVGIYGIALAALGCGVTFVLASPIGSNLSEQDGQALTRTLYLGLIALVVVLVGQLVFSLFGLYTPSWLEVAISGVGTLLFAGIAVVDFYILPRVYRDEQYMAAALSMYLTYINLFIFILRLILAFNRRR